MPLFKFENGTAKRIGQKEFSNEKELHELIDCNLEEIFNLRYIRNKGRKLYILSFKVKSTIKRGVFY